MLSLDPQKLADAVRLGAGAYTVEAAEADELASIIRQAPAGGFVVRSSLMKTAQGREVALKHLAELQAAPPPVPSESLEPPLVALREESLLTPAEQKVLELLARNASDVLIAHSLSTTERTVRARIRGILRKLDLANRRAAVEYAKHEGLALGNGEASAHGVANGDSSDRGVGAGASAKEQPSVWSIGWQARSGGVGNARRVPGYAEESSGNASPEAPAAIMGDVELVITPPLDPATLIRLHGWLKETAYADIGETVGSWQEETVLKVNIRQPIPLLQLLSELPDVAEVTQEKYVGGRDDFEGLVQSIGGKLAIGTGASLPMRFRLTLRAAGHA